MLRYLALLLVIMLSLPSRAVTLGVQRPDIYLPLLKGKRVALLSNHTGVADSVHTLDRLLGHGIDVTVLFSPEHGFRGSADAGAHISDSKDTATGLPIISLYGSAKGPLSSDVTDRFDVVVTDIQDVGLRFYTYYITMLRLMNEAARTGKEFVILDRPNPNGMTVDGPVLDMSLASGVGRLPIPVVHGLTLGELARMAVGEKWLEGGAALALTVVPCDSYTHSVRYRLPVPPSPNLKTMHAVYLYPSTCLFEGTVMSLGRGTEHPFEIYGHPSVRKGDYTFTPRSMPGARKPPFAGRRCRGRSLMAVTDSAAIAGGVNLEYVIDAWNLMGRDPKFFTAFFDKLIGNRTVRRMILEGCSADNIRATWIPEAEEFRRRSQPYRLYPD